MKTRYASVFPSVTTADALHQYPSQLRPPSRIPSASPGKLHEMSASANNARSSAMAPPPNPLKRKTLAERAGEPPRPAPAAPGSRLPNAGVRVNSSTSVSRQTSNSSSVSSMRPPSVNSMRNISNSSYGSSVGSGSRPPSLQYSRPQSAIGNPRVQKPTQNPPRSTTAMDTHPAGRFVGSRKGMTQFSLDEYETPRGPLQKPRNVSYDSGLGYSSGWESRPYAVPHRDLSIASAMSRLNLNGEEPRPALRPSSEAPSTPSQIPKLVQSVPSQVATPSPSKTPRKSAKRFNGFLTRDSNIEVAWDTDTRLEEVETICSEFKERFNSATMDSNSWKDMIADYKARSKSGTLLYLTCRSLNLCQNKSKN